jgi:uncharacterized phage-associated protein
VYSRGTIEKIGNSMIYLAERVPELSKTKLLKLIYLLEETSVKKNSLPFFGIPFEVWQAGPVAKEIFIDLDYEPCLFAKFITLYKNKSSTYVSAKSSFQDDEFSDNDIDVMDYVIEKYGSKTAKQLVQLLHKKGSAWHNQAEKNGLMNAFNNKITNSSSNEIDFTYYLSGCESERYKDCIEFKKSISNLKPQ